MKSLVKYFDTHNHYNSKEFATDANELLIQHRNHNEWINIIGTNIQDSKLAIELANKHKNAFATIGLHPENHLDNINEAIIELEQLYIKHQQKIIAIGECGLDYYYDSNPSKDKQKELLIKHIELAIKYDLPIVLHIRNAHEDCFEILKQYANQLCSIIIHCFSDELKYALNYLSLANCYISFSGIVTFKKSDSLRDVVKSVAIDRILTETDCPFLSPEPHRGKRNDSRNLKYINEVIAKIKQIDIDEINKILINNSWKALKLNNKVEE